jgi:hypothetical protein
MTPDEQSLIGSGEACTRGVGKGGEILAAAQCLEADE